MRVVIAPALISLQEASSKFIAYILLLVVLTCLSDSYLYIGGVATRMSIFLLPGGLLIEF
jgi:hypothetical protein